MCSPEEVQLTHSPHKFHGSMLHVSLYGCVINVIDVVGIAPVASIWCWPFYCILSLRFVFREMYILLSSVKVGARSRGLGMLLHS